MERKSPLKIAFIGGPGVGKTTLLTHFRERDDATIVDEAARDYFRLFPGVDRRALETQSLLLKHVIDRENAAEAFGKPLIVCDRSVVDPIAYMYHYGLRSEATTLMREVFAHLSTYARLYLLDPSGVPYEKDDVRTESLEERGQIHEAFLYITAREGIEYSLLSGGSEERIMTINRDIDLLRE